MFDAAIIGTGPAGISVALTLNARGKNFIWLGSREFSSKIRSAEKIQNYPGLPMVSGEEMSNVFARQVDDMGIEITEKTVSGVFRTRDHYTILCNQQSFTAYSVILATGVAAVKPIPGELEFLGKGVSYCATCDGFLYKNKTIAVVCTSKDLEREIEFLAELAGKVYLIPRYKDSAIQRENVEILTAMPREIRGDRKVEALVFSDGEIPVDGVFMLKDAISPGVLLRGIEEEKGHIVVDRNCATNLPGCFAAGDCTGRPYQYAKAVGEGNVAAHACLDYLAQNGFKTEKNGKAKDLDALVAGIDRSRLPDEASIQKAMLNRLTQGRLDLIPTEAVLPGDVVTFSISGGEGRYARENLRATVAQNLYDETVEQAMVGKRAGDCFTVEHSGKVLTVTVYEVCRKQIPAMTDEMAATAGMEGITTLQQFHDALAEEMTIQEIYVICGEIIQQLVENAPQVEADEDTIARLGQLEQQFFDKHFKETKGKGLDEMTPEEMESELGCRTKEEFIAGRRDWYQIKVTQCHALSKALGVPLEGEFDLRTNYEALGRLQLIIINKVKKELIGGEKHDH